MQFLAAINIGNIDIDIDIERDIERDVNKYFQTFQADNLMRCC